VQGRTLVDGGVVANLAVDTAKKRGADIVIASNITENVVDYDVADVVSIILQAINIMMAEMAETQVQRADVVITPDIGDVGTMDFTQKKRCMQEGIRASRKQVGAIHAAIRKYYEDRGGVPPAGMVSMSE
jgi:NTE family protein